MSARVPEPHAPGARSPLARPSPACPFERVGPRGRVHPDHHDVPIGGAVRTGEGCRAATLRELREEPGRTVALRDLREEPGRTVALRDLREEPGRTVALRELREEPGQTEATGPAEAYQVRADGPRGASFPPVHRRTADRPPRPDPREIARHGSVAPPTVATDGRTPPAPAGAEAVRRLFPL
ncbi:hypothetical protein [Streptomyces sp. bgisy126]|uniref:hypothetical protein n=1 Tax=unclassified Streptomyces TaxID=2593676 RepID=UPI003EBB4E51